MLTDLQKKVAEIGKRENAEKEMIIIAVLAISEYGLQEEVQDYLDKNPDTSFKDLVDFIISLCPPIEIVDDDEEE